MRIRDIETAYLMMRRRIDGGLRDDIEYSEFRAYDAGAVDRATSSDEVCCWSGRRGRIFVGRRDACRRRHAADVGSRRPGKRSSYKSTRGDRLSREMHGDICGGHERASHPAVEERFYVSPLGRLLHRHRGVQGEGVCANGRRGTVRGREDVTDPN